MPPVNDRITAQVGFRFPKQAIFNDTGEAIYIDIWNKKFYPIEKETLLSKQLFRNCTLSEPTDSAICVAVLEESITTINPGVWKDQSTPEIAVLGVV